MPGGRLIRLLFRADGTRATIRDIELVGDASERTQRRIEAAQRRNVANMAAVGRGAAAAGRAMLAASVPLLGLGYYSAKSAIDFEQAMTRIQTQAGVSSTALKELSQGVLNLGGSGQVQYGPTQLANALYHIESVAAGGTMPALKKTSVAMQVLKIAAQGAAVGGSDLEQTTTALMGAMYATHTPIQQAEKMMGLLNATVGAGNMRMQDLVNALGRFVIPAFQSVGLKATDAFAALALFSDQGANASSAAAQMGTALHFLVRPSAQADKALRYLGMSSTQMAYDLQSPKGMLVALRDLKAHMDRLGTSKTARVEEGQVLSALLPGGRGRILTAAINNLSQYNNKLDTIYVTQGKIASGISAQQATMAGKLHAAWAQIQTEMTKFGSTLIPIIAKYLPQLLKHIQDLFKWFDHLSKGTKDFLVKLAVFLPLAGGALYIFGRFVTALSAIWRAFQVIKGMNFGLTLLGIGRNASTAAGEVAGLGTAAATTEAEMGAGAGAAGAASGLALGAGAIGTYLLYSQLSKHHKKQVQSFLSRATGFHDFGRSINSLMSGHPGAAAKHLLSSMTFGLAGGATGGVVTPQGIRRYQTGGPVGTDTVLGWLTPGEGIVNRAGMTNLGTSGLASINAGEGHGPIVIQPSPAYFMVDGRVFARAMINYTVQRAARGPGGFVGGALMASAPQFGTR